MNRRSFLRALCLGGPAAAVGHKAGLWAKVLAWLNRPTTAALGAGLDPLAGIPYYQSVDVGMWQGLSRYPVTAADCVAFQLEKVRAQLPVIFERDDILFRLIEREQRGVSSRIIPLQTVGSGYEHDFTGEWEDDDDAY